MCPQTDVTTQSTYQMAKCSKCHFRTYFFTHCNKSNAQHCNGLPRGKVSVFFLILFLFLFIFFLIFLYKKRICYKTFQNNAYTGSHNMVLGAGASELSGTVGLAAIVSHSRTEDFKSRSSTGMMAIL